MNWRIKNLVRRLIGRPVRADPTKAPLTAAVNEALALPVAGMPDVAPDVKLMALVKMAEGSGPRVPSRELFSLRGVPLPCWREEDVGLEDDWVTATNYYPLYHQFFRAVAATHPNLRVLEIGVRTGYVGVCFARAISGASHYFGVDPNLYLPDSLDRARKTFAALSDVEANFSFTCILGYSDNANVQRTLRRYGPFDIVHVDGDHTLRGKLIDLDFCRTVVAPDGLVLVDDFHHIPDVIREAVGRALRLGWYSRFAVLDTARGMAILQR